MINDARQSFTQCLQTLLNWLNHCLMDPASFPRLQRESRGAWSVRDEVAGRLSLGAAAPLKKIRTAGVSIMLKDLVEASTDGYRGTARFEDGVEAS